MLPQPVLDALRGVASGGQGRAQVQRPRCAEAHFIECLLQSVESRDAPIRHAATGDPAG